MTLISCHKTLGAYPWRWGFAIALIALLLSRAEVGFALSPPPGTAIVNTVSVHYKDANSNPLPATDAAAAFVLSGAPLLHLEKTADSDPAAAGALLTYTIHYENSGNAPATSVKILDTLPSGVTFQTASGGGVYNPDNRTVTWTIDNLVPGGGGSLTVAVKLAEGLATGTQIVNSALMTSTEGAEASAVLTTTVGASANLVLTKTATPSVTIPNGIITYTLSYRNLGNVDAKKVRITDHTPSGTAYLPGSATSPGVIATNVLTWDLGDLIAGSQGEVQFQVRVSPLAVTGQQITNTAAISSTEQSKTSNTVVTAVSAQAMIHLNKVAPESVLAGKDMTYVVQAENTGAVPLTAVILTDPLPAGTTFVSADNGGLSTADGKVTWNIGNLAVGQKLTVTLTVRVDPALGQNQMIKNIATITSAETASQSAQALTSVNARTSGTVEFFDAAWKPAYGYIHGDVVYLQVTDHDQNSDPTLAETITIVLKDLQTGDTETFILTETGTDTGIFRSAGIVTTLDDTPSGDGKLTVASDSRIQATYTDSLDVSPVSIALALIDPLGIVFDSVTGTPVAGTIVTLRNWDGVANACDFTSLPNLPPGQVNPAPPTGPDGKFAFPLAPVGDYCFQVVPAPGHVFPSKVPDTDLPAGYTVGNGSRGEKFTLSVGDPPLIRDIPVDPPAGNLTIAKSANRTSAAVGDLIAYSLKLDNTGGALIKNISVTDSMPHGIQYLPGSSRLNGKSFPDPTSQGKRKLVWTVPDLAPNKPMEITYRAVVGPDSHRGNGVNTVYAAGTSLGQPLTSNTAKVKVRITAGVFTEKGTILGKIFIDRDGNRMQNQSGPSLERKKSDEPGVPNVVLYLEDGTRVITDSNGKFSITGIMPGLHVLRVDETTLPKGAALVPLSNRFLGDGASQVVDMRPSGLIQADFAIEKREADKPELVQTSADPPPVAGSTTVPPVPGKIGEKPTEEQPAPGDDVKADVPGTGRETAAALEPNISARGEGVLPTSIAQTDVKKMGADTTPPPTGRTGSASEEGKNRPVATPMAETPANTDLKATPEAGPVESPPSQALKPGERAWEEEIKTMSPDLEFLSPADGSVLVRERIRVVLKTPFGTEPSLSLNGASVDARQIGRTIGYERGQVTIFEYIDIHLNAGEANSLKAEVKDPFGIVRGTKEITVTAAGAPEKILLRADKAEAPADGSSLIRVDVSFRDKNDSIVPYAAFATVSVSAGEIVDKDADPNQEEFQILIKEGIGQFTIRAPRETGESVIVVGLDSRQETAKVFFTPNLRSIFLVGTGEVMIGHGHGNYGFLKRDGWFDNGLYSGGRGAFFLKGTMYEDILLTAAYDSEKKRRDDLFRENDTNLDGEDKYPIYGDESKTGYEAVSVDKFYLKLEKNRSYLLYGDFRTDLNDTRLAAYNRSFNGLKYDLNTENVKIRSFGSYTDQTQVMDILPGKGISGYYYLTKRPVVEGSERIVIETRDRNRPDIVLSRESKGRGSDYEIDYDLGAILFKEPIPSRNGDYNPIYIVASYESKTPGEKYYVYGGRGAVKPFTWLEIGATGVLEEKSLGDAHLTGTDLTLTLPRKTVVKAEYAETKSVFDETGTFSWRSGNAWLVNMESEPLDKLLVSGYYRTLADYFLNLSAVDSTRGTTKYGVDATYELRPETRIQGRFFNERDDLNAMKHQLLTLSIQTKFQKTKITGAISNESSTDNYIPLTNPNNRSPFDISQETPHELTDVKVGMETELRPDLSLTVSHKQNLSHDSYHMSQAGLNYQLNNQNRLYLREEYQKYEERTETRTLLGVETQLIKNTVAYNEYRLADGADGARNQNVLGLRNKFFIGKNMTGNAAAEYLKTVSGVQRNEEPDAVAGSLGLEYLPSEQAKVTGRFEHRRELISKGKESYLEEVGLAYKLHPDYSLLMRERYFTEELGTGGTHTTSRTMIGIAYRPILTNRFNALSRMEYKHESNTDSTPSIRQDAWIFSGEGSWQATPRLQITGKYAGKLVNDEGFSSYTDLIAAHVLYDLTDRWDVGAEYRILSSYAVDSMYQGGSLEIGYRVINNLWVSAGYSFDKFDADLAGDAFQGDGPYLKLRVKFDENSFRGSR